MPGVSPLTRSSLGGDFVRGVTADLYKVFNQTDKNYTSVATSALGVEANRKTMIWNDESTDRAREVIDGIVGPGYLNPIGESEKFPKDNIASTYRAELIPYGFASSIRVSHLMYMDGIRDPALNYGAHLAKTAIMTQNKQAFDIFNYAFTAQASLPKHLAFYGDGVPFASTVHPVKYSTAHPTQSNASATGLPLTEQNLEVARLALRKQKNDRYLPMALGQRVVLVVPTALEKYAVVITNSKQRSGTANNDLNIYDGNWITVMSSKWLDTENGGSDTAWYLIDPSYSPLCFLTREPVNLMPPWIDNENKDLVWDVYGRWVVGNLDWRGLWGSKGDVQTYSS